MREAIRDVRLRTSHLEPRLLCHFSMSFSWGRNRHRRSHRLPAGEAAVVPGAGAEVLAVGVVAAGLRIRMPSGLA